MRWGGGRESENVEDRRSGGGMGRGIAGGGIGVIVSGDVEEALNAATAIGDDRMQMQARGYVTPESFSYGSSEQRARWFRRGLDSGAFAQCDTFKARSL